MAKMVASRSENLEFITSTLGSLLLAHFYALLERWLDWERVFEYFRLFPSWRGVTAYHYIFMAGLFLLIGGLPFIDDIITSEHRKYIRSAILWTLGNMLLTALIEDAAYFYLYGTWIKPTDWTARIIGYVIINNIVIPNWYLIYIAVIATLYYVVLRLMSVAG